MSGTFPSGMTSVFDAQYFDIVANERVVYVYEMTVDGRKISTSLATFELVAASGGKTKLVLTEQGAFYDDHDAKKYAPQGQAASRLAGTNMLMNQLAALFTR